MKPKLVAIGAIAAALGAVVLAVLWLQQPDRRAGVAVEALAERQPLALALAPPPIPAGRPEPPATASVLFEFDSAALHAAEAAKLDRLLRAGVKSIEAVGHADRIGRAAYNMKLSARRAAAVKDYLVGKNLDVRTDARGEIESATADACFDLGPEVKGNAGLVECLQPDRRVEVTVIGE